MNNPASWKCQIKVVTFFIARYIQLVVQALRVFDSV